MLPRFGICRESPPPELPRKLTGLETWQKPKYTREDASTLRIIQYYLG